MTGEIKLIANGTVTSAKGFSAGAVYTGIKSYSRYKLDLGILYSDAPCVTAGLFTLNKMKAPPVLLCREKLPSQNVKAVVVNSGCANAGTGKKGLEDAVSIIDATADIIRVNPKDILIASTGVIGKKLPVEPIKSALKKIRLSADGGHALAKAIMTTDTTTKETAIRVDDCGFIIGGIAKGSGMIHPQLGTLLCFLATDASVDSAFLNSALKKAVDISFNMVSVDGDTSPNDTVLLMANGLSGNAFIRHGTRQAKVFQNALNQACINLARAIARDGEGASRLIQVTINGASNATDARKAARTIVSSPLVKAAVYGNDPNWGRILAAAGRSGAEMVESKLDLYIGDICLVKGGNPLSFDIEDVVKILKGDEVSIDLNLNVGEAKAIAWGCDLSPEYVTINSQYTT